ncbi:efflux RND transporter periplasmic adaptor subunit [Salidesulfovibrio brasiliensis]|uniref:efflux RND transporter periplasmic adaptor subunit n=1 Tax=Salidesulfovibrio brasiliensis TaxID=221711 RepID=UPI000B069C37|nr:HlyD family efflux transporter periplasmic adaptor subunit [Salidesulfovibrio brasiliensis]
MKKAISRMIRQFPLRVALPALVVIMGAAGAFAMIETAPKAQKRPPEATAPLVDTRAFAKETHRVRIPVMGTVVAARQVTLEARVSGEVIAVDDDFLPGGHFRKGEEMLRIDPTDYELTLDEVRAEVADAQYSLKVEKGHQTVAGREWELLKDTATGSAQEAELALRKPHLEKARADLEAAKAKLDQARLDLSRTVVTAPFSCMVVDTATDLGATVSNQEALATLVGTEACWVRVSVPVDRLGWIAFPADGSPGSKAVVDAGGDTGQQYEGGVIRLLPALEDEAAWPACWCRWTTPSTCQGPKAASPCCWAATPA